MKRYVGIGVARGGRRAMAPKFLENTVILCFERRFSKQNCCSPIIKHFGPPKIFWPLPNFWAGYATVPGLWSELNVGHLLLQAYTLLLIQAKSRIRNKFSDWI